MKLSSTPPRRAFAAVISAAMTYGPTRIPRIAYEVDIPVETCRYYLKKFHQAGFRFHAVVDYRALGLVPHIVFIRFSERVSPVMRENFLRWLERIYLVYRATLLNDREYFLEVVPPSTEQQNYRQILEMLRDTGVIENYVCDEVVGGYYKPEWVKLYDFRRESWDEKVDVEIPAIPFFLTENRVKFDKTDLMIIEELELEPTVKMNDISQRLGISPQLVSYHREKHVEGGRLVTGFLPTRRTRLQDARYVLVNTVDSIVDSSFSDYLHAVWKKKHGTTVRLHIPVEKDVEFSQSYYSIVPDQVSTFTIPTEHYVEGRWIGLEVFIEELEKIVKTI
ncbi:MAG: winged helix-turn-helix domain-containing protein [Candidatus Caldarchaeum sp.]|nr:winged helix-turn-helix domain-containing protein [Candidatus Caldarchaeum sp.]